MTYRQSVRGLATVGKLIMSDMEDCPPVELDRYGERLYAMDNALYRMVSAWVAYTERRNSHAAYHSETWLEAKEACERYEEAREREQQKGKE